jgi:16S rRNA G1207 methylase RsmC
MKFKNPFFSFSCPAPPRGSGRDRLWDAADEYLLEYLATEGLLAPSPVANDLLVDKKKGLKMGERNKSLESAQSPLWIIGEEQGVLNIALKDQERILSYYNESSRQRSLALVKRVFSESGKEIASKISAETIYKQPLSSALCGYNSEEFSCASIKNESSDLAFNSKNISSREAVSLINKKSYVVLIKVSRALDDLHWVLQDFVNNASTLAEECVFLWSGMLKHSPRTLADELRKYFKEVQVQAIRKKALLIRTSGFMEENLVANISANIKARAKELPVEWPGETLKRSFVSLPGVFAGGKLDPASRLLIENLQKGVVEEFVGADFMVQGVLDAGCGMGVLSCAASERWPQAHLWALDHSWQALWSTQANLEACDAGVGVSLCLSDGLHSAYFDFYKSMLKNDLCNSNKVNLIISNPPFHSGGALDQNLSRQWFAGASKLLAEVPQGVFLVVGNKGLQYPRLLKKHFARVENIAEQGKYGLYLAITRL